MTKITVDKVLIEQAIAGAVFDFAGYITSHSDTIEVGSTADVSPIVQRIRAWAKHSGLSIESPNVESWNAVLAEPTVEPVGDGFTGNLVAISCAIESGDNIRAQRMIRQMLAGRDSAARPMGL